MKSHSFKVIEFYDGYCHGILLWILSEKISIFENPPFHITMECCICLDMIPCESEACIDCCSHTFCSSCICAWSLRGNTCPYCRRTFSVVYNHIHKSVLALPSPPGCIPYDDLIIIRKRISKTSKYRQRFIYIQWWYEGIERNDFLFWAIPKWEIYREDGYQQRMMEEWTMMIKSCIYILFHIYVTNRIQHGKDHTIALSPV